jgi:hypothetical protein
MADLGDVARRLRSTDVTRTVYRHVALVPAPVALNVRRAVLSTPTHSGRHSGLRSRIAQVTHGWANVDEPTDTVSVGVGVFAGDMVTGEKSLPLYYEGVKAPWRAPLFGDREHWYPHAPKPFFFGSASALLPAVRGAVELALQDVTRQLS